MSNYDKGYGTGCEASFVVSYDEGYKAGYEAGFVAGNNHAQAHALADQMNRAMDARVNAMLENSGIPVYQGVNTLCTHCGQPVGDTPVQDQTDGGTVFLYCSDQCWHAHDWEAL
jgi:hypothetical protein